MWGESGGKRVWVGVFGLAILKLSTFSPIAKNFIFYPLPPLLPPYFIFLVIKYNKYIINNTIKYKNNKGVDMGVVKMWGLIQRVIFILTIILHDLVIHLPFLRIFNNPFRILRFLVISFIF